MNPRDAYIYDAGRQPAWRTFTRWLATELRTARARIRELEYRDAQQQTLLCVLSDMSDPPAVEREGWTLRPHAGEPWFRAPCNCALYQGRWLVAESDGFILKDRKTGEVARLDEGITMAAAQRMVEALARDAEARDPSKRGTLHHPCAGCRQTSEGNTLSGGWYRCNRCGYPAQ